MTRKMRAMMVATLPWTAIAVAHAQEAAAPAADAAPAAPGGGEGDIVVTANKRNESLVEVPATVSVLSNEVLQQRGIEQFSDYVRAVPGLSAIDAAAPGRGQAVIRGITSGVKQNAPTVTFYLDDVPLTASSPLAVSGGNVFDPDLADVARVEVLKGPQSTLYGASAMGGLIKIVTAKPDFDKISGSARVDAGAIDNGGTNYGARAAINLPIVEDRIAVRLSAFGRRNGGFVDNARYGDRNVNDSKSYGGRASIRIKLNDAIETSFSGLYQRTSGDAYAYETVDPVTLKPLFGKNRFDLTYNTEFKSTYRIFSNTTTIDLGFADLSNMVSHSKTTDYFLRDFSNQYYPFIPTAPAGAGIPGPSNATTQRLTDELRLASKEGSKLEWLVGLFYTREKNHYSVSITGNDPVTGAVLPPPNDNIYTFDLFATFKEYAAFGDLTYHFSDKFEVTGGVRYSHNNQKFRAPRSGIIGQTPISPKTSSDSATTYLVTASFHPTPRSTIYARAASAYRPGSTQPLPNASAPDQYGPDSLWNYEIGAKGDWLGGKLSTELALYYIDWKDIQLNSLVNGFSVISNAGKARSQGVEATVTGRPIQGLTLSGNIAYNRARILTNNPSIGAVAGDPLPFSPKWIGTVSGDYVAPLSPTEAEIV